MTQALPLRVCISAAENIVKAVVKMAVTRLTGLAKIN